MFPLALPCPAFNPTATVWLPSASAPVPTATAPLPLATAFTPQANALFCEGVGAGVPPIRVHDAGGAASAGVEPKHSPAPMASADADTVAATRPRPTTFSI